MIDDAFEERRRRLDEARARRRELMAQAAARRAEAQARRAATSAERGARMAEARERRRKLLERDWQRVAARMTQAGLRAMAARRKGRRRGPDKDRESGGVPAIPDRPRDLSGGAAAELDFDNE